MMNEFYCPIDGELLLVGGDRAPECAQGHLTLLSQSVKSGADAHSGASVKPNPETGASVKRGESREYSLNQDDLRRLEAAARTPREVLYVRLAARWGLRADEIAHFCLDWFSGQRGVLTVPIMCRCEACRATGRPWRAKTDEGHRALPIFKHTETWEAAKKYLTLHPGADAQTTRQTVWNTIKRLADRAGLFQRVFPHALRATAATQFASMGFNELQLCRAMGWSDLRSATPYIRTSSAAVEAGLEGRDLAWW